MAEKQGGRDHIDRTAKYLIEKAGMRPDEAHKRATETRKRVERKEQR